LLGGEKPVGVTGAMRAASQTGYDGPTNLRDSMRAAAAPELRGQGALVVMAGAVHAADDVRQAHTGALTACESLNFGPLAGVGGTRCPGGAQRACGPAQCGRGIPPDRGRGWRARWGWGPGSPARAWRSCWRTLPPIPLLSLAPIPWPTRRIDPGLARRWTWT